jgi:Zn-dependent M28 family amino/carboxypeptidase
MRLKLLISAACALSACATAPAPPTAPVMSPQALAAHIETLSSDAFEGREPASPGEKLTLDYIIGEFKAAGLRPGWRGRWLQPVPLFSATVQGEPTFSVADARGAKPYAFRTDYVVETKRVSDPVIALENAPIVFVGFGVVAPELNWNDYAGQDMRGKIALILVNDPDFETDADHPVHGKFGAKAMTYYGRWTYKYEEAARQGAAGALIIHETAPASYGWGVVESSWTGTQFSTPSKPGDPVLPFQGWVSNDVGADLFQRAGLDFQALKAAAKTPGFTAKPMNLTANLSFTSAVDRSQSFNVVGELRGDEAPDESVLYGAHWDHLGRCTPENGDDICNGAVDNGTGIAMLIELARKFAADGPARRSVTFIGFTAEEQGLLGSAAYAAAPAYAPGQTVGGINMDALSVNGRAHDVAVVGGGKSELEDYLAAAAGRQGRTVTPDSRPEAGLYYRSDHFNLAKVGVPMLYAKGGTDLVEGGRARGEALLSDYTAKRYHKPADEYDPSWDLSGLAQDGELFYSIGRELADGEAWPRWRETAEFRAVRERSRAD